MANQELTDLSISLAQQEAQFEENKSENKELSVRLSEPQRVEAGSFVQGLGDPTVFQVGPGGQLKGIASPEELKELGGSFEQVQQFKVGQQFMTPGAEGIFQIFQGGGIQQKTATPAIEVPDEPSADQVAQGSGESLPKFTDKVNRAVADFNTINNAIKEMKEVKDLSADVDKARMNIDTRVNQLEATFSGTPFETITRDALEEFAIDDLRQKLATKREEVADLEAEEQQALLDASQQIASASFVRGNVARVQSAYAIKKAAKAAQQQALAENLTAAQNVANAIISAKTSDLKSERDFIVEMINLNKDMWESLSDKEQSAIESRLDFITTNIKKEEDEGKEIMDLMLRAPGANIDPFDKPEEAFRKAASWLEKEDERALEKLRSESDIDFVNRLRTAYPDSDISIGDDPITAQTKVRTRSQVWKEERQKTRAQIHNLLSSGSNGDTTFGGGGEGRLKSSISIGPFTWTRKQFQGVEAETGKPLDELLNTEPEAINWVVEHPGLFEATKDAMKADLLWDTPEAGLGLTNFRDWNDEIMMQDYPERVKIWMVQELGEVSKQVGVFEARRARAETEFPEDE